MRKKLFALIVVLILLLPALAYCQSDKVPSTFFAAILNFYNFDDKTADSVPDWVNAETISHNGNWGAVKVGINATKESCEGYLKLLEQKGYKLSKDAKGRHIAESGMVRIMIEPGDSDAPYYEHITSKAQSPWPAKATPFIKPPSGKLIVGEPYVEDIDEANSQLDFIVINMNEAEATTYLQSLMKSWDNGSKGTNLDTNYSGVNGQKKVDGKNYNVEVAIYEFEGGNCQFSAYWGLDQ